MKIILISLIFISSASAFNPEVPSCFRHKTHIHYVNGVNTAKGDEEVSRNNIEKSLKNKYRNQLNGEVTDRIRLIHPLANSEDYIDYVTFGSTYNQTHWSRLVGDLFEAADQIEYLKDVELKYKNEAVYRASRGLSLMPLLYKVGSYTPGSPVFQALATLYVKSVEDYRKDDGKKLADDIKVQLENGNKVLVVSHSQGNLFSNEAFVRLFDPAEAYEGVGTLSEDYKKSIGAVHIASPYPTSLFSNSDSILLKEDLLITPLSGVSGNYSITRGPSSVSSTFLLGEVANVERQTMLTAMRSSGRYVPLPTLGHSIDDLYLSENYFATGTRYNGEEVSMMGIVVDSMNTVAQNFESDCEAPKVSSMEDFIRGDKVSLEEHNEFGVDIFLDFSKLEVGFHVDSGQVYSPYKEGDINKVSISLIGGYQSKLERLEDGRIILNEKRDSIQLPPVEIEEFETYKLKFLGSPTRISDGSKYLSVYISIEDIFGVELNGETEVLLCSEEDCCREGENFNPVSRKCDDCPKGRVYPDGSCDYLQPSGPLITNTVVEESREPPTTCDDIGTGSYTIDYYKTCTYTVSCPDNHSSLYVINFNEFGVKDYQKYGSSQVLARSRDSYSCQNNGDSWLVVNIGEDIEYAKQTYVCVNEGVDTENISSEDEENRISGELGLNCF
ncbi:hypothetical protein [Halobacteriovorax sp. JY17]|uniref:hypothetical protein n=1 Tax=Halobacteriovorax sp. JY17 TaxID=2014617 RepID=UPI0025C430D1|nr:hypothetical protein [Halobacteriovorax sp. JY17]